MRATDPAGVTYRVRRRWLPWRWRRRFSARPWDPDPLAGIDLADSVTGAILGALGAIAVAIVLPILILTLITGAEFLLLLLVLPIALGARLFGRHWQVEVRRGWRLLYEVDGGDWNRSRRVIADLVERIRLGRLEQGRLLGSAERTGRADRRAQRPTSS
ncbi:hypothetical protein P5P86_17375 [Nocardioides sp. BP30]|uniref:hypothetical protein n=1 Tax=Nocardioides sp. BP30 TaxID=3036374 RepID=UPI002469BF82|nr:hypothetical protein [Nocardioides sp. BP30]WGL51716.1 hypothetical protein P5P86_17375 [Nocardioides sp. BP30]